MVKTNKQSQILSELGQFTGTTCYYRSTFGRLLLTEGAHYLRERLSCYWLVDVVESYQPQLVRCQIIRATGGGMITEGSGPDGFDYAACV